MSSNDPPRSPPTESPRTEIVTKERVTVLVSSEPARKPKPPLRRRRRDEEAAQVVVQPPPLDRDAYLHALFREHGGFILRMLLRHPDILEESAKDLRQEVLLLMTRKHDEGEQPPERMRAYLARVVRNLVSNHVREPRPERDRGGEPEDQVSPEPDPLGAMQEAEDWNKVLGYMNALTEAEAEVVVAVHFEGLGLDETAERFGRPRSTVFSQLQSAREKLEARRIASARRAEMRQQIHARRKPGSGGGA